jgi:hypothetical protein
MMRLLQRLEGQWVRSNGIKYTVTEEERISQRGLRLTRKSFSEDVS